MFKFFTLVSALTLIAGCQHSPVSDGDAVLLGTEEPAYTVYVRIPAAKVGAIRAQIANAPGKASLVSWAAFTQNPDAHIKGRIVKDEYPGFRVPAGIVELLRKYPGNPIGLTWNGGVAITQNDYNYAMRLYENYKANPAAYERTRNRDPRADPIHPKGHLGPLLGW